MRGRRVLVTGAGGPSAVSVMNSLAAAGCELWAGDIDPYAAGLYLVEEERRLILSRGDEDGFVGHIRELCAEAEIEALIPTVDSELVPLAAEAGPFVAAGTALVLASEATLRVCLDKWALHGRCADHVRVPETTLVDERFDPAATELPAIVKPRSGSGSRGIHLVRDGAELQRLPRNGTLLVQELLPGAEYSLDVLASLAGEVVAVVPRERLKVDSGIAVSGRTRHNEQLERFGRDVAELIGLTGVANVQVKEDRDGTPALLEVNPRFPGTMPLTIASGIDMPVLCVAEALGEPLPSGPLPFADIAMARFLQERFFEPGAIARLERAAAALREAMP